MRSARPSTRFAPHVALRLRRPVLGVLADADGVALTAHQRLDVLRWRAPRSVPPEPAVTAVLVEAGRLGVLGAGALSQAGRALLDSPRRHGRGRDVRRRAALAVDEVLLQGDLTGIVPGRLSPALEALLDATSHVESAARLTVRFTPTTVRAALDAGDRRPGACGPRRARAGRRPAAAGVPGLGRRPATAGCAPARRRAYVRGRLHPPRGPTTTSADLGSSSRSP